MPAEILTNPGRRAWPARSGPTDPIAFHRRLPGYAVTPLVAAPALAAELGLSALRVKVESDRLGLPAFKMLGASWATYRTLVERLGTEPEWSSVDELRAALAPLGPLALAAATDGNHGRAVARMAQLLGYGAHIFVPEGTAQARIDGIASEGAEVTVVDGTYDDAVMVSAAMASDDVLVISDTSWEGYTKVPSWVIEGYSTIAAEVGEQLGGEAPDIVVVQMGVGALAAAVVDHFARRRGRRGGRARTAPPVASAPPRPATRSRCRVRTTRSWPGSTAGRSRSWRGRRCRPGSTCSSPSTTRPPSGPCATSLRSVSWPARPARPAWPGCGRSPSPGRRRSTWPAAPPS